MTTISQQGLKHTPGVEITDSSVIIKVGHQIEHPMQDVHLIETLDLLQYTKAGLVRVKEIKLSADDKPEASIGLDELKPGTYKIQARCNLHGTWSNEFVI